MIVKTGEIRVLSYAIAPHIGLYRSLTLVYSSILIESHMIVQT